MLIKYLSLFLSIFTQILFCIIMIIFIPFLFLIKMLIFYSGKLELLVFFDVLVLGKIIILIENEIK